MSETQIPVTTAPEDNRVYYNYGDQQIDLKHYIHNLNSNLNRFLDTRRNWSEGQKQAFRERVNLLNQGLQEQLESGELRFSTDSSGKTNDSLNSIYEESTFDDANFNLGTELNNYANRIGGAIAVRGFTKDYYTKLHEAKVKEAERKASATRAERAAQNEEALAYDPSKYGFMPYLKSDEQLYQSANNSFNWDGLYNLDSNPNDFNNRTQALANRISDYYNRVSQYPFDFSNSTYSSRENYLKVIKDAYDSLADGYQEADNTALKALGLDDEFLGNWFSTISPDEKIALAKREEAKAKLKAQLENIEIPDLNSSYTLNNGLAIQPDRITYKDKGDNGAPREALLQLKKASGIGGTINIENPDSVAKFIEDLKQEIVNLLSNRGSNPERAKDLFENLLAYDKVLNKRGISNFIKGEDGTFYLDYNGLKNGLAVVYDGKQVYLEKLINMEETPIYDKLLAKLNISSFKEGGKFEDGGEIAAAHKQFLEGEKREKAPTTKDFNHSEARFGWNSVGSAVSDGDFNMEYEDYARLASLAANIGSMFADPLTGAGIGVGATVIDATADIADKSLSKWNVATNLATNLGLDVVSLIPGMESLKIARSIKGLANTLSKGLAAYGVLSTISNGEAILNGISNISKGDYTRADLQNAMQGVMLLASAVRGGQALRKNHKNAKAAANATTKNQEIGVKINKDGKTQDYRFTGETAEKIRAANGNVDEINKILKNHFGEDVTVGTRLSTIPIETHFPIKLSKPYVQSPITTRTTADVFETRVPDQVGLFGSKTLNTTGRRTTVDAPEKVASNKPTETPTETIRPENAENEINIPAGKSDEIIEMQNTPEVLRTVEDFEQKLGNYPEFESVRNKSAEYKRARTTKSEASEKLKEVKAKVDKEVAELKARSKTYTTLDGTTLTGGVQMHSYLTGPAVAERRKKIDKKFDDAVDDFYNRINSGELVDSKEIGTEWKKIKQNYEDELGFLEEDLKELATYNKNNSISAIEKANNLKEAQTALNKAEESVSKTKKTKEGYESTGWEALKNSLLSEGGLEIGGKYYKAPPEILKAIQAKYSLFQKEGGILKFQGGGTTNIWDAITWDTTKRFKNSLKDGKITLVDRGDAYNTDNQTPNNGKYDVEEGGEQAELHNAEFYKRLEQDPVLAEAWARRYKELNKATGGAWTDGWFDDNDKFQFDNFKKSTLWKDKKNGIGHDVYKGTTYYIEGSPNTYYKNKLDGYEEVAGEEWTDDGLIRKIKLRKSGTPTESETENPEDELEYPSFDEVNGESKGNSQSPMSTKDRYLQNLTDKLPDLFEYLRMRWLNRKADNLTNMALEGTQPFLQTPYEINRQVHGNYRAKVEGDQAAAQLMSSASRPLTSDSSLQTAAQLEARIKSQQYIDAGNKADDAMINDTTEKAWLQEKDNVYNRWKIAMENRRNEVTALADQAKIKHAGESVKTNNTNSYYMDVIKNMKEKLLERKAETEQADLRDIARLATINPKALGIELSNDEQTALNGVIHGGLTYTSLPANYKQAYLSARQKLQWAESDYMRKYKNLPASPYRDAILEGLNDSWAQITDAPAFKKGGQITVAKIKEKIRNADRYQKNIYKQIDSLDKKLDRISKSIYGVGKVAQLR